MVPGVKLITPPWLTNEETKNADIIIVGTVTVPVNVEARVILCLAAAR